jgi:hypothetical protein
VVQGTNAKQIRAWSRFQCYLGYIGLSSDPYLDGFSQFQRAKIISAFAHAFQEGRFCHGVCRQSLKSDSVRAALDNISQAFKLADRPNPRLDRDGKPSLFLQRQLRSYKSADPPVKAQPALTASILRRFHSTALSEFDKTLCELFIGAFFFAMRSCEYVQVQGQRRTKLLCLRNISFFKKRQRLIPSDPGLHKALHKADCVSITFELQKKDAKFDMVSQHRSNDPLLCPVNIWAKIVKRIYSYPTSSPDTPVNTYFFSEDSQNLFSGKELLSRIRIAAKSIGEEVLGFPPESIGLHSARSGAAMAMYLGGVPVFTIMLLGRWSSDAFLRYIRKQVQECSSGMSQKMIANERFFTICSLPSS